MYTLQALRTKDYDLNITLLSGKKLTFNFYQGRLREILDFTNYVDKNEDFKDYLFQFLNIENVGHIAKRDFDTLSNEQINRIMDFLTKTLCKGFFVNSGPKVQNKSPVSSFICIILEKTNETLNSLLSLTWEQIEFLIEGIEWNLNEQTPKGKNRNRYLFSANKSGEKTSREEAIRSVRELEEKLKMKNA